MARQRMTNKRLAELIGVHPNAISSLKNQDKMPRIGGDMLNALCTHLNCTPFDLIEYAPDRPTLDPETLSSTVHDEI
ncbi:MAG: helix-turn-helix transcriptional regulator [Drouetiella hepatica Uher 2000/2452]|jgi:putative transcriptional regulator|uniref:Helix-turn-helix transcriptional regulator n=1 Tax=Drouetiella hepatica Uher 2000/2452 TaxID=904376 RepID=A0A951QDF2_9CYAN|nr:helix-turn-helix transcriptional regulator [Drouetiella hepatica Uher 2000/2452]